MYRLPTSLLLHRPRQHSPNTQSPSHPRRIRPPHILPFILHIYVSDWALGLAIVINVVISFHTRPRLLFTQRLDQFILEQCLGANSTCERWGINDIRFHERHRYIRVGMA